MASHNVSTGAAGESRAAQFLTENGYVVVQRNVRLPGGEIDLICREGDTIVFVEVKRRDTRRFGSALGAVNARKRATLRKLAADYLQVIAPSARARFDVVTVEDGSINLHKNAF